jgi:6-phosphogluconolactonase
MKTTTSTPLRTLAVGWRQLHFEKGRHVKTTLREVFRFTFPGLLLIALSACGGGGDGGGGTTQSSITQPVSSGSAPNPVPTTNPVPTINSFYPSCAPAGEQLIDSVDNQLVVGGQNFVANSVVRWNGADQPTTLDSNSEGGILTAQISASDIAAAGTAVVTVFNPGPGGGTSNSLTFTITIGAVNPQAIAVDPAGKFAYVMNGGCNGGASSYVSMYTIDPTTGTLASIGPPVPTYDISDEPGSLTVAPSGKFVYVTNPGDAWVPDDGSVAMYTINATTGALTSTGTINGNCPGLCFPASVVVDPSGKFAYVANSGWNVADSGSNDVSMYAINATTGALTSIGSIATGADPASVAVDPSGKFAYVANSGSNDVSMYAINATTGASTSIGTIAAGTDPVSIAVDPSGKFAYVVNENYGSAGDVSMYAINAATGALTSIGTIAAGRGPLSVAVDPTAEFAYVTNSSSNDVSMYAINSTTGALTSIGTIAAGSTPSSIAIHPSGQFAYVTNSASNDVSMYSIDSATGALTLMGTIGT